MTATLRSAQTAAASAFRESGLDTPALDARILLTAATGLTHEALISKGDEPLGRSQAARFFDFVNRRVSGEPVSRIRGSREFYGREFQIDRHTLDPRPDTETLVEAALSLARRSGERPLRLLDLGTGSGCLVVTLLAELPEATGTGVDIDPGALRCAQVNAGRLGVGGRARFVAADWFEGLSGRFDLIVSNPPYIPTGELAALPVEVAAHDPAAALDGGPDGLDAYRRIAAHAAGSLVPGGHLLVEIGSTQDRAVAGLLRASGLTLEEGGVLTDLAGRSRCICAKRPFSRGRKVAGLEK